MRPPWASALSIQFEDEQQGRSVDFVVSGSSGHDGTAKPAHQGDVLFPVDHVSNGRTHAGAAGLQLKQLLALIGAVGQQPAIVDHLEDQIAGRGDHAATDAAAARRAPDQLLGHGIPGLQHSALFAQRRRAR